MKSCPNCGQTHQDQDVFCRACGRNMNMAMPLAYAPVAALPAPNTGGRVLGVLSIICATASLLFLPICFGPVGLVMGILSVVLKDTKLGTIGIVMNLILPVISFAVAYFIFSGMSTRTY